VSGETPVVDDVTVEPTEIVEPTLAVTVTSVKDESILNISLEVRMTGEIVTAVELLLKLAEDTTVTVPAGK